jgi:AcrR family transcriptional regulator
LLGEVGRYREVVVRPAQTARSERTREALRRAALVRFLAQGVEGTSPEQIAGDAGVSVRTFYRHFTSKHDLLFADYDAGLHWFRSALAARPDDEPITESVRVAVLAFPYDVQAVTQIAVMRSGSLDADRIVQHMRQVEADFAEAVAGRLERRPPPRAETGSPDTHLAITVTARCIAAAVFGALEVWMMREERSLPELAELCRAALDSLNHGITDGMFRHY